MDGSEPTTPDSDTAQAAGAANGLPDSVPRQTLFEEATREAHRHKWIESEEAGRDLGEEAIRQWHQVYWRDFCRERWIEHLQGIAFWVELDNDDFGLLKRRFHDNVELVDKIVEKLQAGGENLDVIQWAVENGEDVTEVVEVLKILDINARRLAPAVAIDEQEFVEGIRARHCPRVLIVDDDEDTCEILAELFVGEEMECVTVSSGEAALEEVQSRPFDLFMIDIMLPGKHGAEIAWYLHRHGVANPIVAISAVLDAWDKDDLYDCGFTKLMAKPFDLEEIREIARTVVERVKDGG